MQKHNYTLFPFTDAYHFQRSLCTSGALMRTKYNKSIKKVYKEKRRIHKHFLPHEIDTDLLVIAYTKLMRGVIVITMIYILYFILTFIMKSKEISYSRSP